MPTIVITCFELALQANGERIGGMFERALFRSYLERYPAFREELWRSIGYWLTFNGEVDDIAMERMNKILNEALCSAANNCIGKDK